ncbi:putative central pro-glu repeat-containing protein [Cryptosporidium canis]|uniref:Central pro-glu repeat-containing protein n=1 Tax=Cryptosporidium canis TaxID=195482 RepID=A0ABQ8PC50_9CRYT|nr:putative central pro-glu repeat-containing protein [Cryptosporidium canis]
MNGSDVLESLEKFQAERSLSHIIENDPDYGGKLSKLLAHNSSGVPMLGISNIRFRERGGDSVAEVELLVEELISKSKVLDGSKTQLHAYSSIEGILGGLDCQEPRSSERGDEAGQGGSEESVLEAGKDEVPGPAEGLLGSEEKDEELEECLQLKDVLSPVLDTPGGPDGVRSSNMISNSLNLYFDSIYDRGPENLTSTLQFDGSLQEDSPGLQVGVSLETVVHARPGSGSGSGSGSRNGIGDEDGDGDEQRSKSVLEPEEELGGTRSLAAEAMGVTLRLAPEGGEGTGEGRWGQEERRSDAFSLSSEERWRMKIENMMRGDERGSFAAGHSLGTEGSGTQGCRSGLENLGRNSNLCGRDSAQRVDSAAARQPGMLSAKDLRTGVIREIEHELKDCRLSLNARGAGGADSEPAGRTGFCWSRGHHGLGLDLDLSFGTETDQEPSTDSDSENPTPEITRPATAHRASPRPPPQYSLLDTMPPTGGPSCAETRPSWEASRSGRPSSGLAAGGTLSNSRQMRSLGHNLPEAPKGEESLAELNDYKKSLSEVPSLLERTLSLSYGSRGAASQPNAAKNPESVISAIKLLGVVRDIKRQIKLIKSQSG